MDTSYHPHGTLLAIYVTAIGSGRWEVRASKQGERAYAYPTRDSALAIARSVASNQWEQWGFPCCVCVREREDEPWVVESTYGPTP
jgi:hypothetical protein